jgi:ribosomal protein L1
MAKKAEQAVKGATGQEPADDSKKAPTKKDQAVETVSVEKQSGTEAMAKKTDKVKETPNGSTKETHSVKSEADNQTAEEVKVAKAGKRSAKALAEAEEKEAKEERKQKVTEVTEEKPKIPVKPARSKLERKGKKFRKAAELIDRNKSYGLSEALELAVKTSPVKFDATVELHVRLGVDPRQADQNIRDMITLPAGTGKTVRVAVIGEPEKAAEAKKAGADIAASDEFLQQLEKGTIDFDILIATPAMMPKLGKYARLLGPKGLMPNPKSGTVAADVAKAVNEAKAGRVEYRVDSTGIVHLGIGKVSFGAEKLAENAKAVLASIKSNKPGSLKGAYFRSAYVSSSMGPSIPVSLDSASA